MKIYSRLIAISITLTFTFLLFISFLYYLAFPLEKVSVLWEVKVLEVPFIIIVPILTVLFGISIGVITSIIVQKRVDYLEKNLSMIVKNQTFSDNPSFEDMVVVQDKLRELQHYIQQQTIRAQKLIEDRANDYEEKMNQVISEERNRLARELHDSVSQELFAASMLVSAVNATNTGKNEQTTRQLEQIETIIQQAQLEMRALLLHLRPVALRDKTLKEGMEQLLQELQAKVPITISYKIEDVYVNKGVEDHLFRVLQEALSNALRHAKAEVIDILCIVRDQFVILRVKDNGIGFNMEETKVDSYGMTNMKERVEEIGGHIHIVSIPNEGTKLEVRVPCIEEDRI